MRGNQMIIQKKVKKIAVLDSEYIADYFKSILKNNRNIEVQHALTINELMAIFNNSIPDFIFPPFPI